MMNRRLQETIFNNLFWFAASFGIAVIVWFVATLEADPIGQRRFTSVDIQIEMDEGLIITNNPSLSARVIVRAQQTVLELLTEEDVVVRADLRGRGPGTYTIPLTVETSRPASADTQPAQITISLQQIVAQQKPVVINPIELAANFAYTNLALDVVQAEVSGAPDNVNAVVEVRAALDLREQRSNATLEEALTLFAVDENGARVQGVIVNPRTVVATLDVFQRDDVRIVTVRPAIQFDTLPDNFEFRNVEYEPRTVIINGPPEVLIQLGDTVDTLPISLADRTSSFAVDVPLALPEGEDLLVLSSEGTVSVRIEISEQTMSIPFENIPITIIGAPANMEAHANPDQISVVLNGPVSVIEQIQRSDVQAVVDVNGLLPGTFDLVPQITLLQGQISILPENLTLLPTSIDVVLTAVAGEATTAPEPPQESQQD